MGLDAEQLSAELTGNLGLTPEDARRATFTILAWSRGWNKARIGRHLGVSRARVHQRIDKYRHYAERDPENWPVLSSLVEDGVGFDELRASMPNEHLPPPLVEFKPQDWKDDRFATSLIGHIEALPIGA